MSTHTAKLAKQIASQKREARKRSGTPRWRSVGGLISGIVALVGLVAAVVTLLPRIVVTVSDPVDSSNPFSSSITVANTGYLPLQHVETFFGFRKMTFGNPDNPFTMQLDPKLKGYVQFASTHWQPVDLGLDDRQTYGMNDIWGIQPNLLTADIAIEVKYKILYLPIRRLKTFPFVAKRQTNGQFYWYSALEGR